MVSLQKNGIRKPFTKPDQIFDYTTGIRPPIDIIAQEHKAIAQPRRNFTHKGFKLPRATMKISNGYQFHQSYSV